MMKEREAVRERGDRRERRQQETGEGETATERPEKIASDKRKEGEARNRWNEQQETGREETIRGRWKKTLR